MDRLNLTALTHFKWRSIRTDPAVPQLNDPGGVFLRQLRVVGHHDHKPVLRHFPQQLHNLDAGVAVQSAGRFIGQENIRVVDQRPRDGHALHLSAGHLAKAMAAPAGPQDVVIAADTIVVCGGRILGKPGTEERAAEMLRLLSGRDHQVMTGFTVRRGSTVLTQTEVSHIFFRPLDEGEIDAYVATGEPLDKAGAYGIQGLAALFVTRLEGDFYNVMGLPLCALAQQLRKLGVRILGV